MTIQELESTLPSGFHDAYLHRYEVDLVTSTALFYLNISVGDPESESSEERDAYRMGHLTLHDLDYLVNEPPDPKYEQAMPWMIDLCDSLPDFPKGQKESGFRARFYSSSTNSFIHFSASDASFAYEEESNQTVEPRDS